MTIQSDTPWWRRAVIYHIYPRSFKDSDGNGIGDLQGILDKLNYLQELGVDGFWLSPVYPSPQADFGYDVSNYVEIDPQFGDLADFDQLIKAAHARELKVIMDFVPSHTSDQHLWFQESIASLDNPKRDWYIWADPSPNGDPPTNWLSVFGGSAWAWDEASGQYYMHSFLAEQPDLNWRNPEVREAIEDVLRFWFERGVDGFRVDAVRHMIKDDKLRDNPPATGPKLGKDLGEFASLEERYTSDLPGVHNIVRSFRTLHDSYPGDRMMVGEVYILEPETVGKYYGDNDEFHLAFNFIPINHPWEPTGLRDYIDAFESYLPDSAQQAIVFGSHDENRLATRCGEPQARVAAMMLLTLRGTPFIYYGDELGMVDGEVPPENTRDPWSIRSGEPHLSRDPGRTPMHWNSQPGAGFSPADSNGRTAEPWLPISSRWRELNVETESEDPASMLNLHKQLIRYRKASSALQLGEYQSLEHGNPDLFAYIRSLDGKKVLIVLNFSSEPRTADFSALGAGHLALSTHLDRKGDEGLDELGLRGDEGVIIELAS